MTHVLRYAARTDRGLLRANNQDSVFAGDRLLVIADGMGGHAAGDVASRLVVAAFVDLDVLPAGSDMVRPLTDATRHGNAAIAEMVDENPEFDGMGTTLTALLFDGSVVALAHVGDSRAYLYRNGVLHQISHDDTFVQSLVDDGRITAEEAAHHPQRSLLLRALNGTDMDPSITLRETSPGDRFLICSDGLSDVVSPESIADTLAGADPDQVADTLIQLALVGGGPDNVTVIVADVVDTGRPGSLGIPGGNLDPEATGPMQRIHLTQKMPRVALPAIPEDVPAKPEYASVEEGPQAAVAADGEVYSEDEFDDEDLDEDDLDEDESLSYLPGSAAGSGAGLPTGGAGPGLPGARQLVSPPPRGRWHRRWAFGLALVVLIGVGLTGSYLWATTKYYVGANADQVTVFKGINGSLLGWKFATAAENSCGSSASACNPLKVNDLVQAARDQVSAGIPVGTLADARAVIIRLTSQQLPPCPVAGAGTTAVIPATTGTSSSAPSDVASSSPVRTTATTASPTRRSTAPATPARTVATRSTTARPTTAARSTTAAHLTVASKTSKTTAKPRISPTTGPPTVTITVTVTVNPTLNTTVPVTSVGPGAAQRLRSGGLSGRLARAPVASGPVTRAAAAAIPTVTVFTTITGSPTSGTVSTSTGTPLVSPVAQPGVTCRLVP